MTQMFLHQAEHVAAHSDKTAWGLWHEMGTGKTVTILNHARQLFHNQQITGIVVIAPSDCYLNWLKEIPKHAPEMSAVAWQSSHVTRSAKNLDWLVKQHFPVFIVNVESLSRDKPTVWKYILGMFHDRKIMLVVDESSCIKNPKAKCTVNVHKLGRYAKVRRCLNGTPGIETPFDVWSQLEFLTPGCTRLNYFMFTKTYGIWEKQYYGPRNFDKVVGYQRIEEVRKLLERHGDFIKKRDCLDLPDKLYQTYHVEVPDIIRRHYTAMKKHQITVLEETGVIAAENALDLATKLHDLATGFMKSDDDTVTWISDFKFEKLVELLKSINGQVVIFCSSRPAIARIMLYLETAFPGRVAEIHGGVDMDERPEIIARFQAHEIDYLVCNQQTAGRGITLTAASYVIYFRNSYSLERRVQSEDRAHRIGQDKNVTYIDMVCDDTIEERVVDALEKKMDVASILLQLVQEELKS